MDNISLNRLLIEGALYCGVLGVLILGSLYWNPRLWMNDYPKEIRDKMSPLTDAEKKQRNIMMVFMLLAIFGIPILSLFNIRTEQGKALDFGTAYLYAWIFLNLFNLFDALVIDLYLAVAMPAFAIVPEARGREALLRDPRMHIANFLKGIVFCTVMALPLAGVGMLL